MRRQLFAIIAATALILSVANVALATKPEDNPQGPDPKVWVCKYVGQPGVDEVLQTGTNPIVVSVNATGGTAVGSYFSDAQGRSFVLAVQTDANTAQGNQYVGEVQCPVPPRPTPTPQPTPTPTPTPTPVPCEQTEVGCPTPTPTPPDKPTCEERGTCPTPPPPTPAPTPVPCENTAAGCPATVPVPTVTLPPTDTAGDSQPRRHGDANLVALLIFGSAFALAYLVTGGPKQRGSFWR